MVWVCQRGGCDLKGSQERGNVVSAVRECERQRVVTVHIAQLRIRASLKEGSAGLKVAGGRREHEGRETSLIRRVDGGASAQVFLSCYCSAVCSAQCARAPGVCREAGR